MQDYVHILCMSICQGMPKFIRGVLIQYIHIGKIITGIIEYKHCIYNLCKNFF